MMHPIKYVWAIRAVVYKLFWGHIGKFTYIGKPVFIEGRKNIKIGDRVRIFPGVRMEAIGTGSISVGNNVAIEQNVHLISSGIELRIGSDVTISGNVFITNTNHRYDKIDKSVMEQENIVLHTNIGDGCFIGYGAVIQAGTILGKHCIVGANAVVKGKYPDNCVIVGVPSHIVKRYDLLERCWKRV